jgi:hypothetical protein
MVGNFAFLLALRRQGDPNSVGKQDEVGHAHGIAGNERPPVTVPSPSPHAVSHSALALDDQVVAGNYRSG